MGRQKVRSLSTGHCCDCAAYRGAILDFRYKYHVGYYTNNCFYSICHKIWYRGRCYRHVVMGIGLGKIYLNLSLSIVCYENGTRKFVNILIPGLVA